MHGVRSYGASGYTFGKKYKTPGGVTEPGRVANSLTTPDIVSAYQEFP